MNGLFEKLRILEDDMIDMEEEKVEIKRNDKKSWAAIVIPYLCVPNILIFISMKGYSITCSTLVFSTIVYCGMLQFLRSMMSSLMHKKIALGELLVAILMMTLGFGLFSARRMGVLIIG